MINQAIATILAEAVQKYDTNNYLIDCSNKNKDLIIDYLVEECIAEDKNNIPREIIKSTIEAMIF